MSKQLVIPCSRMTLVFDENEFIKLLPPDRLQSAISKGKGLKRAETTAKRVSKGFDRWNLYEALKNNMPVNDTVIRAVEVMPVIELREGVIEHLLAQRQRQYTRQI